MKGTPHYAVFFEDLLIVRRPGFFPAQNRTRRDPMARPMLAQAYDSGT